MMITGPIEVVQHVWRRIVMRFVRQGHTDKPFPFAMQPGATPLGTCVADWPKHAAEVHPSVVTDLVRPV